MYEEVKTVSVVYNTNRIRDNYNTEKCRVCSVSIYHVRRIGGVCTCAVDGLNVCVLPRLIC